MRHEELTDLFEDKHEIRDTKVRTAIAWLERSGFLQRNQNLTDVYQGKPLVKNIREAKERMEHLNLAPATERLWLNILGVIINSSLDRGLNADKIAEGLFPDREQLRQMETATGLKPSQILKGLSPDLKWEECAILARTKSVLSPARSVLEQAGLPVKISLERSFPLQRVREIVLFVNFLKSKNTDNCRTSRISELYAEMVNSNEKNIWLQMVENFLDSYRDETADAILPSGWILDRLFEYLAEQRREKVLGQGIFLGTIHSAKGMEFSHVFILDGDWSIPNSENRWEEERRVLYVAMTRAKETKFPQTLSSRHPPDPAGSVSSDCA
jgi:hypothetical protein